MTFPETIKSLSYTITENENNKITIEKQTRYSVFTIIFNMEKKYINACLQPKILIHQDNDLSDLTNDWNLLKQDLSNFKKLSGYVILYPTGEHL